MLLKVALDAATTQSVMTSTAMKRPHHFESQPIPKATAGVGHNQRGLSPDLHTQKQP
jgi:hypothetical protein